MPVCDVPPDEGQLVESLRQRPFLSWREDHKAKLKQVSQSPEQNVWIKANGIARAESLLHMALLAYQSDEALLGTARLPHRGSYDAEQMQVASLDHSIWFHHSVNVNNWLLDSLDNLSTSNARGYIKGEILRHRW